MPDIDRILLTLPMPHPKGYVCYHAGEKPTLNGRLDDPVWKVASWTDDFHDIEGAAKPKPRFLTRAKMLWDDEYFYVGAEIEEPHVWATLTEHDSVIFHDNDFEVFIDPDGDNLQYYEIEINALNTEWDLRLVKPYRDGGPALNEWEIPGFRSAVHVDGTLNDPSDRDHGWTVELAFPWKALAEFANRSAPPHEGDQWRVNFSRVEWKVNVESGRYVKVPGKPEDNWVWSPQGVVDMHRPERWGYLQFTRESAQSGRRVAFRPDTSHPIRKRLHRLYYAQRLFHAEHGRWAATLTDLHLRDTVGLGLAANNDGYIATVKDANGRRWHIRQDSRIWQE
jgi:hypothetical protein